MYSEGKITYRALPLPDHVRKEPEATLEAAEAFLAMMRKRHSIRDFSDDPVDEAVIHAAIATAGTAPSGANHQPWHFVAIRDAAIKAKIREAAEEEERAFYAGGAGDEWPYSVPFASWMSTSAPRARRSSVSQGAVSLE